MQTLTATIVGAAAGIVTPAGFAALYDTTSSPTLAVVLGVIGALIGLRHGGDK